MNLTEQTAVTIEEFPGSFKAWCKSAVISWLVLCLLMSGFAWIMSGGRIELRNWIGLLALSSLIHVGTYALIGIPFFAFFWPRSASCVWSLQFSLPMGGFLGFMGMWLAFSIVDGRPLNLFDPDVAGGCLYGLAYGMVTAIVAWRLKIAEHRGTWL